MSPPPNATAGPSRPPSKLNAQSAVFLAPAETLQPLQPPFAAYDRPMHHLPARSPGIQHQPLPGRPPINHLYAGPPAPGGGYYNNGYGAEYVQQQHQQQNFGGYQAGRGGLMAGGWQHGQGQGQGQGNSHDHYYQHQYNPVHNNYHQPPTYHHSTTHHNNNNNNHTNHSSNRPSHLPGVFFPIRNGPPVPAPFVSPPPPLHSQLTTNRSPLVASALTPTLSLPAANATLLATPSARPASLGPAPPLVPTPESKPAPGRAPISFTPNHDQTPPTPPTFAPPPARSSGKRVKPPLPRNAGALSFGPNVRPPPGVIAAKPVPVSSGPSSAKGEGESRPESTAAAAEPAATTPTAATAAATELVASEARTARVAGEEVADAGLKAEVPGVGSKEAGVARSSTVTVASSSTSTSSPVLPPPSPTTTTATTVDEPTFPSTPKSAAPVTPLASAGSSPVPATVAVAKAPAKKSWADLVRSPTSAAPPVNANGVAATPITEHVPASAAHKPVSSGPGGRFTLAQSLEDVERNFSAPALTARGLVNNGNLCFANAILQVLVYTAPFWNLLATIKKETSLDLSGRTPTLDAMVLFLEEFRALSKVSVVKHRNKAVGTATGIGPAPAEHQAPPLSPGAAAELGPGTNEPFVPEQVYESLKANERFDLMTRGTQEDAEEFLGFFLDTLHEEVLATIDRVDSTTKGLRTGAQDADAEDGDESWTEVGLKGRTATTRQTETRESPITKIFGGQLRSLLRCPGQKDSITLEPYQRLQLDIQPDSVRSIEDALANLAVPEPLPDYTFRGARADATKQVLLDSCPPVLVLHLKRFLYNHVGGVQKSSKRVGYGTELEVGPELLAPGRRGSRAVRYSLYGVVYHHGASASGGHYTVAVRQQRDANSWLEIDDTSVRPISQAEVVVAPGGGKQQGGGYQDAYLLLYNRVD